MDSVVWYSIFMDLHDCRVFKFDVTATFMGLTFETGNYVRDYISLKHVWDNIMMEKLGKMYVPGERFHQAVHIPWNGELREIRSNEDLMDLLVEFEEKKVKQIHFIVEYLPLNVINHESNTEPNIKQVPKPNPKQGL
ncbi:hypothetical protein ACOSQ4_009727 [Xanthoceras sorbifolium]